jgi:hypothetical protein
MRMRPLIPQRPPGRALFLIDKVKQHGFTLGVELGILKGRVFFTLLDHCPRLTMIGVDTWYTDHNDTPRGIKRTWMDKGVRSYKNQEDNRQEVEGRAIYYTHRAVVLAMSTAEAALQVDDASVDFIFIDASHEYEGVKADILAWKPKIKPGGMLSGHDIDFPSVKQAVDELVVNYKTFRDNVWMAV